MVTHVACSGGIVWRVRTVPLLASEHSMPPVPLLTADEFFDWQPPDKDTELVRGRMIVREPPRLWHGLHAANLCRIVSSHVWSSRLGAVLAQDTGFHIARDPDTVLAPDLAFIRADRLRSRDADRFSFIVPDLVAEIVSPSDRRKVVVAKMYHWITAGVRVAWLIEPKPRRATICFADGSELAVAPDGMLTAGDVLPGFACALREVFE
jgi:Uma2 family endonuclease